MRKILLWITTGAVVIAYPIFVKVLNADSFGESAMIPTPTIGNNNQTSPASSAVSTPSNNAAVTSGAASSQAQVVSNGKYKDGVYTGSVADAFYGNIQVKATVVSGKISKVDFLQYPNDRGNSIMINQYAMPILAQEAISVQSENVDIVSGATDTSQAFIESLSSALKQAS